MKAVILVPYRGGDPLRDAAWKIARRFLEGEVVTGDAPGEGWNRSAACNAAAATAGDWDVAVVADADTIHEPGMLAASVERVARTGRPEVPWDHRLKLRAEATEVVDVLGLEGIGPADVVEREARARWNGPHYPTWKCGSTITIPRAAWDAVGGFDEGFHTWGHEDCAQRMALQTLAGLDRHPGTIWHLWHPSAKGDIVENRQRFDRYRAAAGKPDRMAAVIGELVGA